MAELLLELFSEEIPAGLQDWAAQELGKKLVEKMQEGELKSGEMHTFATPRRLTLVIQNVPEKTPDISEERKGPRVGAPDKAIAGFLRSAGLEKIDQAEIQSDKKGEFYLAVIDKPGEDSGQLIARAVADIIRDFPWPKSMRWGTIAPLRWVRPLHSVLCLLGNKSLGKAITDHLKDQLNNPQKGNDQDRLTNHLIINSEPTTYGHRFMAPEKIEVKNFADYRKKLAQAKVMLSGEDRQQHILSEARKLADSEGLELIEDRALLRETAGLVEWPVVLMGRFDEAFLDVPPEVLIISMKKHQKCFSLRRKGQTALANRFILVSNLLAKDGGKAIRAGNEKVINARLSDARFFWDQDRKTPLEMLLPKLDVITFHARLGTQGERVKRLVQLAGDLAPFVDADEAEAKEAAGICKADLVTEMVGEFPDLQGTMGQYYAKETCHKPPICQALNEHYLPQGPSDPVPTSPVSIAVALADRFDILTGFWGIDEKPTGSKDPYALRRAALGIIRIILENKLRLDLSTFIGLARHYYGDILPPPQKKQDETGGQNNQRGRKKGKEKSKPGILDIETIVAQAMRQREKSETGKITNQYDALYTSLLSFFMDRLKVYLKDKGVKYDRIDAILAAGLEDDLYLFVQRVEALDKFLSSSEGADLLAGVKRATNILRIEEKKDRASYDQGVNSKALQLKEEKELATALKNLSSEAKTALKQEDFQKAMQALSALRNPVDAFFDHVTVNEKEEALRKNRLNLLGEIRSVTRQIADLSKIEG